MNASPMAASGCECLSRLSQGVKGGGLRPAGTPRPRLYTLVERALLHAAAATLLCQHLKPIRAAEKLAQEKNIPLHDAIAFVAPVFGEIGRLQT